MIKDLTSGKPLPLIISFAMPTMLGLLFQQLYNAVDMIIVGKYLGVNSVAAVGATSSLYFLIIGFCNGNCTGFAIPVAQRFGAKDYSEMRRFIGASILISSCFAIVMTITTAVFTRPILVLMQTPSEILDESVSYIRVIFLGLPAYFLYNMLSGILRSVGDSKTPVYFLIFSSLLNIVLDLLFIIQLNMGVVGASLATVVSLLTAGLICLWFLIKKFEILHLSRSDLQLGRRYVSQLLNNGLPMGLQFSITAIGSLLLQSAVNRLGASSVAAYAAAYKVQVFVSCPFDALGTTMSNFGAQNVGARKFPRIKEGLRDGVILGLSYSVIAFVIVFFWGRELGGLFIDKSETKILDQVQQFLTACGATYGLLALIMTIRLMIQGMGYTNIAMLAGVCELISRAIVAIFLVPAIGYTAVCMASPIAWLAADLMLVPTFFACYKKLTLHYHPL